MQNTSDDDDKRTSFGNFVDAVTLIVPHLKEAAEINDPDERERFLRQKIDELKGTHTRAFNSLAEADRSGFALWLLFQNALRSALARSDLSDGDKAEASSDAAEFSALFELFSERPRVNCERTAVFQFASKALLAGLQAGLAPAEVRKLREGLPAELGRSGGKRSGAARKANRRWVPHATQLAVEACSRDPNISNEKIADAISDWWKLNDPNCPGRRTLSDFISDLRARGTLPQRSGSLRK
jgi:hypothetical protein